MLVSRETEPGHFLTHIVPAVPEPARMQHHMVCLKCPARPSVFCLSPDDRADGYRVTIADVLSGILSHIRRSHPDVVTS